MIREIKVPDIGSYANVSIIEVLVKEGDKIKIDTPLITLETDKATMEIPSPFEGIIQSLKIKVGDTVSAGDLILTLESAEAEKAEEKKIEKKEDTEKKEAPKEIKKEIQPEKIEKSETPKIDERKTTSSQESIKSSKLVHAGPGVRRFARELGVDLGRVSAKGPKNRILKTDVQNYVKQSLQQIQSGQVNGSGMGAGLNLPPWPEIDFSKFGEISTEALPRIKKLSGTYLHRNWVMVPHVTQFDEADITELEQFRKEQQKLAEQQGVKLTPLVFIMKAVTTSLKAFPSFNASLDASGGQLILKKYYHIGVAVDTPNGLVVPVVRDVDQKGLFQLALELGELSAKARKGQLTAQDMQGSTFSISSLGGIGGTAFTPIINVPDVAILGVSRSQIKPVYQEDVFVPRLMLSLSLSYDHRVIDGAEAARFSAYLVKQLSDIRRLLL